MYNRIFFLSVQSSDICKKKINKIDEFESIRKFENSIFDSISEHNVVLFFLWSRSDF